VSRKNSRCYLCAFVNSFAPVTLYLICFKIKIGLSEIRHSVVMRYKTSFIVSSVRRDLMNFKIDCNVLKHFDHACFYHNSSFWQRNVNSILL